MSSENIITEALENQYLDEEDSEGSSLESDVAGDDLGFRIESDSSGSEYNQDDFGEEDSDSEQESVKAQKPSEIEVNNDPYQGQDFDKLVNALKESDHVATGKSAAQQWEKSIEEEMIDFSDIRDELRGASGVGKRRKKLKDRTQVLPPEIRDLIGQANVHYVLNEFDAAIEKIEQVLTTFPEAKSAWTLAASIKTDMGEHDASLRLRVIAALIPPCDSDVWKDLAGESRSQGATQQAVYCLSQAIKYNKYDFDAIWDRSVLYKQLGIYRQSINGFKNLLKFFNHDPNVLNELCPMLLDTGDYVEIDKLMTDAWEYYQEHFPEPEPDDTGLNINHFKYLVTSQLMLRKYDDAVAVIKQSTRWLQGRYQDNFWDLLPDDREFDENRFERVGDHRIEFGMGVFKLDADMRISLGQARLELGQRDEAKRHFSYVLKLDLEANVALYGEVGNSFMKHEMFEDALEVFKIMEDNERTCSTPVYRNLAVCHKALNNLDMAEQIFEHVCQLEPDNMDVTMQLAETYESLGKREQALATISKILYRSKETQKSSSSRRGQVQEEVLGTANNKASLLTETYTRKTPGMKKLPGEDRKTMRDMAMRVEEEREAEMKTNWETITQLDEKLNMHNREIVEEWLNAAREVLEIYRDTVQLFPKNKNQKFKGIILNQKANSGRKPKNKDPQDQLDEDARIIAVRLERALVDQQHIPKIQEEGVQYFRHIHFDDWVDLTLKYAILNTRYSNYEEADEVLKHMSLSNALNTPERQSALKFCRLVCASMASDIATVVEVSRQYIFDEQFGIEGLRMLCTYLGRSHEGLMGFTEVNLQKFLLREVKMFDVMATGSGFKISNKKHRLANTNETDNVEEEVEKARDNFREANLPIPTEQNPYYLGFYGQIMLAAKSAQTSIYYLLRAYELEPNDYVICLSLTCAYLYRAFQRQADNRHHLIGQAAAFLNRYRELRGECDEVEYNYGRFYHQLGLLGIATKHYEKVLKIENAKHTSEAAFNLWLIYYATNARGPMKSISDKYLRPEKFKKNDILV